MKTLNHFLYKMALVSAASWVMAAIALDYARYAWRDWRRVVDSKE